MKRSNFMAMIFAFILFVQGALAQCDHCSVVLNRDIRDEFVRTTSTRLDEAYSELFSKDYEFWETYEVSSSSQKTKQLDAAYKVFKASFGSTNTSNKSEKKEKYESMKEDYSMSHTLSKENEEYIMTKTASATILKAWERCIELCSVGGIKLTVPHSSENEFTAVLSLNPQRGSIDVTKVTSVVPINAEFLGGTLSNNAELKAFSDLNAVYRIIDNTKKASLIVSVERFGSQNIEIAPQTSQKEKELMEKVQNLERAFADMQAKLDKPTKNQGVPIGSVVAFPVTGNIPDGWKICNGATLSKNEFPDLFKALGTKWNRNDDDDEAFRLPDFRGVFLRGLDNGKGIDNGRQLGTFQDDEIENHSHNYATLTNHEGGNLPGATEYRSGGGGHRHINGTTNPVGGSETRPKNYAVNYIIRCK
jgi:Phage Tail Collar Domain